MAENTPDDGSNPKPDAISDAKSQSSDSSSGAEKSPEAPKIEIPASSITTLEHPDASGHSFHKDDASDTSDRQLHAKRSPALAAVIALAAIGGGIGGAMATLALGYGVPVKNEQQAKTATADDVAFLKDAIARINADVNGAKAELDRSGKTHTADIGKLNERLDHVSRAQDDTSAKMAKINEPQTRDQDRPRAVNSTPPADTTGVISSGSATNPQMAARPDAKPPAAALSIVDGWTLSRVSNGGAVVNGPDGLYEAYPGDPLPGLGRVDAVRYQDGRWVVVTQKGLIVRR
jgi:hypothetical protein